METFVLGFALSASLCLDLGIVNLALLQTGLQRGGWAAFALGAGSTFGDVFYALLATFGIGLLLSIPWVRVALWLGGTSVLLYLAWKLWQQAAEPIETASDLAVPESHALHFRRGLWLAVSSPSAILWFATVGGSVMATSLYQASLQKRLWFYAGFFVCGLAYSATVALLIHHGRSRISARTHVWLNRTSALLFVALALKVAWDGWRGWGLL
jgi:L-lysine exporter family protein LysE/ArgO